jgi:hypothetical protein
MDIGISIGFKDAGGFNPRQLSNLLAWYDASDATTITESSGNVSQWDDKSDNANHATQGTGGIQPETDVNTQNGKNVLLFDGDDYMLMPSGVYSVMNGANTMFVVSRSDNANVQDSILNWDAGSTVGGLRYKATAGSIEFSNGVFAGVTSTGNTETNFNIIMGRRSGTTAAISINGATETTNTTAVNAASTRASIGTFGAGGADTLTGDIAEIIIYNASLSASDISLVNTYLSNKWGIALA